MLILALCWMLKCIILFKSHNYFLFVDEFYVSWNKIWMEKWDMSFSLGLILMGEDNFRIFQALFLVGRNEPSLPSSAFLNTLDLGGILQTNASVYMSGSWVFPLGLTCTNHLEILFPGTFTLSLFTHSFWFYSSYSNIRGCRSQGFMAVLILSLCRAKKKKKSQIMCKGINSGALSEWAEES